MDNRDRAEKQRRQAERQRQEDVVLTKVLYWLSGAVLLEVLLFLTKRFAVDFKVTDAEIAIAEGLHTAMTFLPFVGLALAALAFVWAWSRRKKGHKGLFLWAAGIFLLGVAACAAAVRLFSATVALGVLIYVVLGVALLSLIYYLYQREFFTVALLCALSMLGLWSIFRMGGRDLKSYVYIILLALFCAVVAVAARMCQANGGALTVKGRSVELLGRSPSYALIYVTCALTVATQLVALLVGGGMNPMVFYAVPVAWVLVMAVYYTVKLM